MTLGVDTSVWSLALRRDAPAAELEVDAERFHAGCCVCTPCLAARVFAVLFRSSSGLAARNDARLHYVVFDALYRFSSARPFSAIKRASTSVVGTFSPQACAESANRVGSPSGLFSGGSVARP